MRIEFLVEDISGSVLIQEIMKKYNWQLETEGKESIEYNIKPYKGIGVIKKTKDAKLCKSQQLLSELPKRLRALQYQYIEHPEFAVFIVLDNDKRKTDSFYDELKAVAESNGIKMDYVFCIAVEEMEAWLLGDYNAILTAYPNIKDRIITKYPNYQQDSICDTWEMLADMLTPKGFNSFKKDNNTVYDIGKKKTEWAMTIGSHMDIRNNRSPSFQHFVEELDKRVLYT